jgi:transcriptional regulator with XRE-family HTH domain
MKPTTKPQRTAEQRAEEEAIRRQHAENPVRQAPAGAINRQSFTAILNLVAKFKASRESQGLMLAEVAERMGMDAPALSRLETGKVLNPTLATLYKWAEALGQQLDVHVSNMNEEEHRGIFAHYGAAASWGQHLETTLMTILMANGRLRGTATTTQEIDALETILGKKTLGNLARTVRAEVQLPEQTEEMIRIALDKRNYLIHHFFSERAFDFNTATGRQKLLTELREIQAILCAANTLARTLLNGLAKVLGITPEMIEAELQEMRRGAGVF